MSWSVRKCIDIELMQKAVDGDYGAVVEFMRMNDERIKASSYLSHVEVSSVSTSSKKVGLASVFSWIRNFAILISS